MFLLLCVYIRVYLSVCTFIFILFIHLFIIFFHFSISPFSFFFVFFQSCIFLIPHFFCFFFLIFLSYFYSLFPFAFFFPCSLSSVFFFFLFNYFFHSSFLVLSCISIDLYQSTYKVINLYKNLHHLLRVFIFLHQELNSRLLTCRSLLTTDLLKGTLTQGVKKGRTAEGKEIGKDSRL